MKLITANRLNDGHVIFLSSKGWTRTITDAFRFSDDTGLASAMDRAQDDVAANEIVDPYEIDVEIGDSAIVPVRLRERIRALGPTTGNSLSHSSPIPSNQARVA